MDNRKVISQFEPKNDNMINILHALQNNNPNHYLATEDLKLVAEYLNTTYSSVHGIVRYYSMFSLKPRGKYVIRICKSPLCQMIDGNNLAREIKNNIGVEFGEVTDDLMFSVESSECLGHCAEAPVMMINETVYKDLDATRIKEIFQNIKLNEQK